MSTILQKTGIHTKFCYQCFYGCVSQHFLRIHVAKFFTISNELFICKVMLENQQGLRENTTIVSEQIVRKLICSAA
jgi:PII-like signaling protein